MPRGHTHTSTPFSHRSTTAPPEDEGFNNQNQPLRKEVCVWALERELKSYWNNQTNSAPVHFSIRCLHETVWILDRAEGNIWRPEKPSSSRGYQKSPNCRQVLSPFLNSYPSFLFVLCGEVCQERGYHTVFNNTEENLTNVPTQNLPKFALCSF